MGVEYTIEFNDGKFEYAKRTKWDKQVGEIIEKIWTREATGEKDFLAEFNYKKYFLNRQRFDDAFPEPIFEPVEWKFMKYNDYPGLGRP